MLATNALRAEVIQAMSSHEVLTKVLILRELPLVVFGPTSTMARMYLKVLAKRGANFILAVDDFYREKEIEGIPVCTSREFLDRVRKLNNAVAIDFSQSPFTQGLYRELASHAGITMYDMLELFAAFDAPAVYEPISIYRERTIARADDWLKLADRLADDTSRATLYAVLLQRLNFRRDALHKIIVNGRDEYFGQSISSNTFVLGKHEDFVDAGAHRGTVITKFLGVTDWQYSSIHAFEPDSDNFAALSQLSPVPLSNWHIHNCAISDRTETLRFAANGDMSSHVSTNGAISVPCVRLDDKVEKASLIKMDVEGYEPKALQGAKRLISEHRPRLAIAAYHYAHDLLDVVDTLESIAPDYRIHLRHHFGYFFDSIIYATPRNDWGPVKQAA